MSSHGVGSSFYHISQSRQQENNQSDSHSVSSRGFGQRSQIPGQITPASRRYQSQAISHRGGNTNNPASILSPGTINEITSQTSEQNAFCWGTNIDMEVTKQKIETFLKQFKALIPEVQRGTDSQQVLSQMEEEIIPKSRKGGRVPDVTNNNSQILQEQQIYMKMLENIAVTQNYTLTIDADHLYQFDKVIYSQLIDYPAEIIPLFDNVLAKVFLEVCQVPESQAQIISKHVMLGIVNLRDTSRIRALDPKDINKLISIKGIVIRCSEIHPEMKSAFFRCVICGESEFKGLDQGRVNEPIDCKKCKSKHCFQIDHNRCLFVDKQYVKIQEKPDDIPEGETPATVTLLAFDNNVDLIRPGDKIEVVGLYRASAMRKNKGKRTLNSLFNSYVDVVSYGKLDKNQIMGPEQGSDDDNQVNFTQEVKQKLYKISDDPNVYERLTRSLAPSIYEQEDVKQGILCQLFGGTHKEFSHSGKGRFRADVNVLLIGDPSMAKSQFLKFVNNIAPRGIYTSGKGSSAVGLTAYVSKDPETKELVLESGALVLSDLGICCIDEFDKMADSTRSILHEAMEQQTISIAKAGIVAQLNARTAILAGANPVGSRYDPKKSVIENINLPPSLISRFDLIYILLDKNDEASDRKLADHILKLYVIQKKDSEGSSKKKMEEEEDRIRQIDMETLSMYISFARQTSKPKLTSDVHDKLVNGYLEMRKLGANRKTITSTPRQLESMIRLSEALAKMRLAEYVTVEDVEEALRLIKVATMQAATDPTTGLIDVDLITSGYSAGSRQKIPELINIITDYIKSNPDKFQNGTHMTFPTIRDEILVRVKGGNYNFKEVQDMEITQALQVLQDENQLLLLQDNRIRVLDTNF